MKLALLTSLVKDKTIRISHTKFQTISPTLLHELVIVEIKHEMYYRIVKPAEYGLLCTISSAECEVVTTRSGMIEKFL